MSTLTGSAAQTTETALFDFRGLAAGIRWRRRLWAGLAVVGLLLGVGVATALPNRATATTQVFVIHGSEGSGDVQSVMKTDLALLQTSTVAAAAVDRLRNGMEPERFLGTYSGVIVAGNILEITAK